MMILLYGAYTAESWRRIRQDPEVARTEILRNAERAGCRVSHFYFALDEFDFYAVLQGPNLSALNAVRHQLVAEGSFIGLYGGHLSTYHDVFPLNPTPAERRP